MVAVEYLVGGRELISVGLETEYGTAVAPTYLLSRNARWDPNKDANKWEEALGSGADNINVAREIGDREIGGTLTYAPQDWAMLYFVFGLVATTGETPVYTHTFTNMNTVPSFTLQRAIQHTTPRVRTYEGMQVDSATISFSRGGAAGGGYLDLAMELIGEDIIGAGTTTELVAPTTAGFQFRNVLLTLNTTAVVEVVSGNINVNNTLNEARYGNYTLNEKKGESAPQLRKVTGNFVIELKDDTFFDFWNNRVVVPGTNTLIFQRATNDTLTFTFTGLVPLTSPDPTNLEGINQVTVNWEADYVTPVAVDAVAKYFAL